MKIRFKNTSVPRSQSPLAVLNWMSRVQVSLTSKRN